MHTFKKRAFISILVTLLGLTTLSHAAATGDKTSKEEIKQETAQLLHSLKSYSIEQRDEAVRETEAALKNLDRRIDALEAHIDKGWDKMDKVAREKARESLKALRTQRTQVAEWYGRLKNSAGASWGHIKEGFSDAYRAFGKAWEQAENEFGSQ